MEKITLAMSDHWDMLSIVKGDIEALRTLFVLGCTMHTVNIGSKVGGSTFS